MESLLALLLGYSIGAFPSAFLLGKLKGQDIFKVGSGNMGAMNTARNIGYGLGILVLLLDLGKGTLATYIGLRLFSDMTPALIAGAASVLGHAWSVYIGFRGGKGLATALGVTLPLYPVGGLASVGVLILLMLVLRKVNLASFMVAVLHPIVNFIVAYSLRLPTETRTGIFLSTLVIGIIIAIKHLGPLKAELQKPRL